MKTTLNKIREHEPCKSGWEKLLAYLGKTKADDEPLSIATILDSNGLDDALWCLRSVEGHNKDIRLFAVWCAKQVQHLMTDQRSLDAINVAERYANGEATKAELKDAWAAARDAAEAAWSAARNAATWTAAEAARTAAEAAWSAARAAERTAAEAAWSAARAAAWAAARDAAEWSAADVAGDEMRKRQADELRRICEEVER